MLVLARKRGQKVKLDGGITISVVAIRGDKVRLGFDAPRDVNIWREELENEPTDLEGGNEAERT